MNNGLRTFVFQASHDPVATSLRSEVLAAEPQRGDGASDLSALDAENVAQRYVTSALASSELPSFTVTEVNGQTSEFKSLGVENIPFTNTKTVKLRQYYRKIPVYGSLITVELEQDNELVSLNEEISVMTNSANLQWFPTNAPIASSRTDDIWFIDPMVGWAVNSNGQIIKTTDGGNTWEQQFQDNIYLRCIGFASALKGWAGTLTAGKRLYSTTDGGQNWQLIDNILPALAPSAICGLSVVNESVVYGSGTNFPNRPPRMVKTVDGGATWTAWDMSEYATLLIDNYFINPDRGWVVGGKADKSITNPTRDNVIPVVLYTEDGGKTWVNQVADISSSFPLGEWGWKIFFLNENIGFVSLENFTKGAILKTTDGGKTWKRLRINDPQENVNLEGVGFVDENLGWVGGWGYDFPQAPTGFSSQTNDGGENWEDANHIGQFINRFRFFGNPVTVGYASGLTVYKYSAAPVTTPLMRGVAPLSFLTTNAPAKFEKLVNIEYTLPDNTQKVTIDIWNQFGAYVRKLVDESNPSAGQKSVSWDGKNDEGETLPPGIFIYRLTVDGNAESRVIRLNP